MYATNFGQQTIARHDEGHVKIAYIIITKYCTVLKGPGCAFTSVPLPLKRPNTRSIFPRFEAFKPSVDLLENDVLVVPLLFQGFHLLLVILSWVFHLVFGTIWKMLSSRYEEQLLSLVIK